MQFFITPDIEAISLHPLEPRLLNLLLLVTYLFSFFLTYADGKIRTCAKRSRD